METKLKYGVTVCGEELVPSAPVPDGYTAAQRGLAYLRSI